MASLLTLLNNLASKAGVDLKDPKYAGKLPAADAELPDDLAAALESNLFNTDAAKNSSDLDKFFKHKNLGGVDNKVKALAEDEGLDAADVSEILAEKNSFEKITLLKAKVKAKLEKDFSAKAGDKKALVDEVTKLNNDIKAIRDAAKAEIQAAKEAAENEITNYAVDSHLRSQKYANEEVPVEANSATARFLIEKHLKEKGAKLIRRDGELRLINAVNPDLDYMESNQPVKFSDLSARVLADNKLLKVSDPSNGTTPQRRPDNHREQRQPGKNTVDTSRISAQIKADADALRVA